MKDLKVNVKEGTETLVVRTGSAEPIHEVQNLNVTGSLETPGRFLAIRGNQFPVDKSHVIVNEDSGTIVLKTNDRADIGCITVTGKLEVHPDVLRIGINDGEMVRTTFELAQFIKMNRSLFETKAVANELVSKLRNFEATVSKELVDKTDDRGNYATRKAQIVESNIPDIFSITIPLFVGGKPQRVEVEIVIDPSDLSCTLVSPDTADFMRREKKAKIDEQVALFEGYVIVNV